MKAQLVRLFAVMLVLVGTAACGHHAHPRDNDGPTPETRVRVVNRAFADMTIYVLSTSGGRTRLGTVTGNTTQEFVIPSGVIGPATSIRMVADPIGGARASVTSSLAVQQGQTVTLEIPPS